MVVTVKALHVYTPRSGQFVGSRGTSVRAAGGARRAIDIRDN